MCSSIVTEAAEDLRMAIRSLSDLVELLTHRLASIIEIFVVGLFICGELGEKVGDLLGGHLVGIDERISGWHKLRDGFGATVDGKSSGNQSFIDLHRSEDGRRETGDLL
jgi:hypothetical protein